jgi:prevent-host-death family protein
MAEKLSMKKVVAATEVRNHFGAFLNRVYRGDEHLVVEKSGIPVAALIGMKEYEAFRRFLAQQLHHDLGRQLGEEFRRQVITEDRLMELMEEDRAAVYQERYGRKTA